MTKKTGVKLPTAPEAHEQTALFRWIADAAVYEYPELELLYHIPNGGTRNRAEAAHLKQQGVKSGVPDLCLPVARGKWHGLYIEMKAGKNKTTENQDRWIESLRKQGYVAEVCYGYRQAAEILVQYLSLGKGKISWW